MKQSNFTRLEAEGLIDQNFKFTDEDRGAIERLSAEEVDTIIKVVRKLDPNWSKTGERARSAVRGIIL